MARKKNFFVEQLKKIMYEKELNQQEVAELIGSNQRVISRWLTGNRNPSLSSIKKIASALDLPINFFIENSGNVAGGNITVNGMDEKDIKILQLEKEVLELKLKLKERK
jgi:transcriptional regulator with XRE-family HTH domain